MIEEDFKKGWRQHFPTYHFDERDIALEEYKVATKSLESEERVFLNASNVTLVSTAALGSLLVGKSAQLINVFSGMIPPYIISLVLMSIIVGFSFISLKYFSDRQRAIVFAARKVIILRRMLGLSYGNIQLLLPNWRVEGADQPLALKMFPGWLTYAAYPFWIVSIISSSVVLYLSAYFLKMNPDILPSKFNYVFIFLMPLSWFISAMLVYRTSLLDAHESSRLIFYRCISKVVGLPLTENIEYIIYRAKLAVYETERHKISTENIKRFLVFIEDKDFYEHSGISYKAIMRSILGLIKLKPRSGGSTIVQQLIRTLFITNLNLKMRRKFIELALAPWLTRVISKEQILDIYISAVRFERGQFGILKAMNHFWGRNVTKPTKAQSFFLVERVSNIRSRLLVNKIIETVRSAKEKGLLSHDDINSLINLYTDAVKNGKIIAEQADLDILRNSLNS